MGSFEQLVGEQLKTMEKLLFLQSEVERCQEIERELVSLQDKVQLRSIRDEIELMKAELAMIQRVFEEQTEDVIQSYQDYQASTVL
ncbi:hypothetical protein GJU40_16605 [Bacillus lacus]|uniref:YgaB-like protein n=1 Tax=Metabacillus lacus TaxID=1983721 RepID=A0A7X2J1U5_9BACI|nr:YgaB family protein [Metabacillus lacus]MRX73764.1 hypothetical protein [Metabacillus lacus]